MTEEEKKRHAKVIVDVEINAPLMDILKDSMVKLPDIVKMAQKKEKSEK